jgi:hypothetical protein
MSNGDKHTHNPKFVYVTEISTTPEKHCNASIDEDMTKQYWVGKYQRSWHHWRHQ